MILIVLLAVGPFLHAHYGKSTVTGFHIAGMNSVSIGLGNSQSESILPSFLPSEEGESAAIGVETSFSRKGSMEAQDSPKAMLVFAAFALFITPLVVIEFVSRLCDLPQLHTSFSAGFPALTHAPPANNR